MDTLDPAASTFIEQMGLSLEADGLPRIAGRMWGYFIIQGGPCSFAQLAADLKVSRGSISTNARLLRALGILQRVALPGDRQDYYQLAEHPMESLLAGYVERMHLTRRNAEQALEALPDSYAGAKARLTDMRDFYQTATRWTEQLISTMRERAQGND